MAFRRSLLPHCPTLLGQCWFRRKSSRFNGVHWNTRRSQFEAQLTVHRVQHHLGYFDCEVAAACSYDDKLRSLCDEGARLKKSLNFPTCMEQSFLESTLEARARGMATYSGNIGKEKLSVLRLQQAFLQSPVASGFEIVRVSDSSRSDALFKPRWSDAGIRLQVKSATAGGWKGRCYRFTRTCGYGGMLMILVALDCEFFWVLPGALVAQKMLSLTLGTPRHKAWRALDVGVVLKQFFQDTEGFPRVPLHEARLECSASCKVEEQAHLLLTALFTSVGFQLCRPILAPPAVDSLLTGHGCRWRVQEKAANRSKSGRQYAVSLWKSGGALGRTAYANDDFDMLVAAILDDGHLSGIFIFPICVLQAHGLVGQRPGFCALHPPWSLPKTQATRDKYAWQLDFFVDLRGWIGETILSRNSHKRLKELLHPFHSWRANMLREIRVQNLGNCRMRYVSLLAPRGFRARLESAAHDRARSSRLSCGLTEEIETSGKPKRETRNSKS